jgi:hypothetical protein
MAQTFLGHISLEGKMKIGPRRSICFCCWFAFLSSTLSTARPAADPNTAPCSAAEYHQFDFFLGDWDAFETSSPDKVVARNHVDSILGGCVVREDYQGNDGHEGQSFSIYDASSKTWHQSWVTNRGDLLLIDGRFENCEMILTGHDFRDGKRREVKGVWKVEKDGVRETASQSMDGGKNWSLWFDMMFRTHRESRARGDQKNKVNSK